MDKVQYVKLLDELHGQLLRHEVGGCLLESSGVRRRGRLSDVFRKAYVGSSLGSYGGVFWWYGGRCYVEVSGDDLSNSVYDLLKRVGVPGEDLLHVDDLLRVVRRAVSVKELVVDHGKVAFRNCVLDLESGKVCSFCPDVVVFSEMDYDYDERAECWRWRQFLDEVLPQKEHQRILQEFLGMVLIDRKKVKMEQMLILKGSGANGKSVVFDVVCHLFGESNVSHFTLKSLLGGGIDRKRNIASINGKRLNYSSETDRFVIPSDSGMLKALISGEPLEARPMRGMNFAAKDIPLLMMNANILPEIKDWSYGMRRRVLILPFTVEIPKWQQDATLPVSLRGELSGIMNWVLEGRKRFVGNQYKLTESEAAEKLADEYQGETSNVIDFMRAMGYERRNDVVRGAVPVWKYSKDIYGEYTKWCISAEDMPEKVRKFLTVLRDGGWRVVRRAKGWFIGCYGERALKRQAWLLKCDNAAKELNVQFKGEKFFNWRVVRDMAEKVMTLNGWTRCAVGFTDLQEYLGYTFDWRGHLNRGQLDGTYVVNDGVYFFNLTAIDELWRPQYEEGIKARMERKLIDAEYRKLQSDSDKGLV